MKKLVLISAMLMSWIARADVPATHGMLLFGDKVTYASHLPMFHAPHDYQVILQVGLSGTPRGLDTLGAYEALKAKGETMFTLVPQPMDLTQVIDGSKTSFTADLYQGHFEKGRKNLGAVGVSVTKIVFSKKLDPQEIGNENPKEISHLVFGSNGEYFAAHLITSKPSFDSILKVGQPFFLKEMHCRTRACSEPKVAPLPDSQLPTVFKSWVFNGPVVPLKKGDFLDSPLGLGSNKTSEVLDVIYSDDADLSH